MSGGGGPGVRLPRHTSDIHSQISLHGSGPEQEMSVWKPGGEESGVFARHTRASKGNEDCKSHKAEDSEHSSPSLKELETIL